ncbi:MAG TPA: Trk system potassium transporter TrkA [Archaeoglobus profundus]|nr:Trk system potassium transporter TrkA [Archaeoglobus profundus]
MHIVIAGAGEVGYNLAKVLSENHDVYVIEKDEEKVEAVENLDVKVIQGNAANLEVLKEAYTDKADIFLAVTGCDEVNLLAGIAARRLGAKKIVVRVGNPEYVEKPIIKNHPLGYDLVICPQLALANEIVNFIMIPGAIEFISLSGGKGSIVEILISEDSPIVGKRISELNLPKNIIITAIHRDGEIIVPRGDTTIKVNDRIVLFGKYEDISKIKKKLGNPVLKNVAIFGGGVVGMYVAKMLDKSNLNVKIIDPNLKVCEQLSSNLKKVKVIHGDPTDLDFLIEEEIGKSDIIVATTESDEKNLLISLLCKSLGSKKTIAKVEKGSNVKLFEQVGVDVALSPRKVTFIEVMKNLRLIDIRSMVDIAHEVTVAEIIVNNKEIAGKQIREIKLPKRSIIGCILRGDECIIPRGDTEIKLNDKLLVFTTWEELNVVEEVFKK